MVSSERNAHGWWRRTWWVLALVTAALSTALLWPLSTGEPATQVVPLVVGGVLLGALGGAFPKRWTMAAAVIALVVLAFWAGRGNLALWSSGALGLWAGLVCATTLRTRPRPESGSPRLAWDDGTDRRNQNGPSWTQVEQRFLGLDASGHTMISIHKNGCRLDICCPEPGRYLVFHTSPGNRLDALQQVVPGPLLVGEALPMRVGGTDFLYPNGFLCEKADALRAASRFWVDGTRATELHWVATSREYEVLWPPPLSTLN